MLIDSKQLKKFKITCVLFHILIVNKVHSCINYSSFKVNYTIGYVHFTNVTEVMIPYDILSSFVHSLYI